MKKIALLLIIVCIPGLVFAQGESNDPQSKESTWEFDIAPYIWYAGISADISFLNQTIPVEAKFKDVLKDLKFGVLLHAEAKKDNWFIMSDLVYMKLNKDGRIEILSVDTELEIKQLITELAGGYNLINAQNWLFIDGFAGWRYFGITNKLDIAQQNVLDKTTNVNDPFIGLRFRAVSEKWVNSFRFDVGGFGIGSEVSWKANLLIGYQFSRLFSLYLGAQGYGVDFEQDNFQLDVVTGGFITGFNFHF
jgi:hypothetical protein